MYTIDEKLKCAVEKYFAECKEYADYVSDHPEIGGENPDAEAHAIALLKNHGDEVTAPYLGAECSFLAVAPNCANDKRPRAALMCEYDALPDVGHACGHSISGAITLLAALALNDAASDLPFRIDVIGTPGEEYPGCKSAMTRAGAFSGYEFCAMIHLCDTTTPDALSLACNDRFLTFKGRSAHASGAPCEGRNALNAARLFMDAMDMWRQHIPTTCQLHGVVEKGGYIPSAVPDEVQLNYYFRAKNMAELDELCEKAEKAMQGAALATGTEASWEQRYEVNADLWVNPVARPAVTDIFDAMGIEYVSTDIPFGSTDCGEVDQVVPTFQPLLAATGGRKIPLHNAEFAKCMKSECGYEALKNGGLVLASLAQRFATDSELWAAAKAAHKAYRGY